MQKPGENSEIVDIGRRDFLGLGLGAVAACTLGIPQAVAQTLDRTSDIPLSFVNAIESFEGSDSPSGGNVAKYRALVEPMVQEGLNTNNNLAKLRYLIYRELKKGYQMGASADFREYDAEKVWNDADFFGDIGGPYKGEYLQTLPGIVTDARLDGKISIDTPDHILSVTRDRLENQETENIAFIMKDADGTNVFIYYEAGKLKYWFPTTPGVASLGKTPDTLIVTERAQLANYFEDDTYKKTGRKRPDGTKGGPMAYSRRLDHFQDGAWRYDGHNTHVGHVTGKPASHGCARQGILGAYLMFYGLKPGTLVYYRPELSLPR